MSTRYITSIGLFYKNVGILLGGFLNSWMIVLLVLLKKFGNEFKIVTVLD